MWPTMKRTCALLCVASCGASTATSEPPSVKPGSRSSMCPQEYAQVEENWASYMPREKATSPFRHCPRWHVAAPEACDANAQPSFFDPCHCMCDLCERDEDCGVGASCVTMSSVICGGYDERVCVRADDPCHPSHASSCPTRCVTLFGKPQCISADDARMCKH